MSDPSIPKDPTKPADPIVLPRARPGSVTLSGLLMLLGSTIGLVSAIALFVAPGPVVSGFRLNARSTGATPAEVDAVANVITSVFVGSGLVALLLAVAIGLLAPGVLGGRNGARIATLVLLGASLCCGLGSASYTTLGRSADWTLRLDNPSERLVNDVGQAYGDAMPGVIVGATGGLTDLQALGYIAVAILLLVPASHAYFRSRPRRAQGESTSPRGPG